MSDNKPTSSATNRLVELLRSQQVGSPDETDIVKETVETPAKKLVDEVTQPNKTIDIEDEKESRNATKVLLDVLEKNRKDSVTSHEDSSPAVSMPEPSEEQDEAELVKDESPLLIPDPKLQNIAGAKDVEPVANAESANETEEEDKDTQTDDIPLLIPDPNLMKAIPKSKEINSSDDNAAEEKTSDSIEEEAKPAILQSKTVDKNTEELANLLRPTDEVEKTDSVEISNEEKEESNKDIFDAEDSAELPSLLTQIQSPLDAVEDEGVKRRQFDTSLLTPMHQKHEVSFLVKVKDYLFNFFNESVSKVAIFQGKASIKFLELSQNFSGLSVERYEVFPIPLEVNGVKYVEPIQVLEYVLAKCADDKRLANACVSYFGDDLPVKTQMFNAPDLSGKELSEFIQWNITKNLAFGSENTNVSFLVNNSDLENVSKQIVVGMGESSAIDNYLKVFKKHKLSLRRISTMPAMLWKLFVHNYPDKKSGCYVIVHIGDNQTIVVVVYNKVLLFTREISIGVNDIRKALKQRVVSPEGTVEINDEMADDILFNYGIPENADGIISEYKISLYKISIFLRPAIERITSEMTRSQAFFRKQYPKITWDSIYLTGVGGKIPGLPETLSDNLNLDIKILHPARVAHFSEDKNKQLKESWLPDISPNMALMVDDIKALNILPEPVKKNYHYTYLSKLVGIFLALILPIVGLTMYYSQQNIKTIEYKINTQNSLWKNMSQKAKEFYVFRNDLKVLQGFNTFLKNDSIESQNNIKLLKLISTVPSEDIKFTSLSIDKKVLSGNSSGILDTEQIISLTGFVDSDLAVADIHIANLQLKFEQTKLFKRVELDMQDVEKKLSDRLFFKLILSL